MEYGGLLHEHGNVKNVDKKLDSDPVANHKFLEQRANLVRHKQQNPSCRSTSQGNPVTKETVSVHEEKVVGLRAPPMKFMELDAYQKRFGPAAPEKIRVNIVNGQTLHGVDIVDEQAGPSS